MAQLKEMRLKHNYTQKQLAKEFGCDESTISYYENGKRKITVEILQKYCKIFNCTLDELVV